MWIRPLYTRIRHFLLPLDWPVVWKSRDQSFCSVPSKHLIDYSSILTAVDLPDVSFGLSFGWFSRFVFSNSWTDRSTRSSCGLLPIHRWWVPSNFARFPLWGLGWSFRRGSASDNCCRMLCRVPPNSPVGLRVALGLSLLLRSWSLVRKVWITPDWRC